MPFVRYRAVKDRTRLFDFGGITSAPRNVVMGIHGLMEESAGEVSKFPKLGGLNL